jgi:ligand-binding sensor domain-containing protein/two-component sensor histidine kinase
MNPRLIAVCTLLTLCAFGRSLPQTQSYPDNRAYAARVWRTQDGLPENAIQSLAETADGYLWIGTAGGLVRFDGAKFSVYNRANTPALVNDSVHVLYTTPDGSLWIGTDGGGLLRFRNGSFERYAELQGITNGFIKSIYRDRRGVLWTSTAHGLFCLEGTRFVRTPEPATLPVSAFWDFAELRGGSFWVRSTTSWFRIENGEITSNSNVSSHTVLDEPDCAARIPGNGPRYRDRSGDLWIGIPGAGLARVHDCAVTRWYAPDVVPGDSINAIFEDRQGSIWVGTEDGLLRLSRRTVRTLSRNDGFAENNVSTAYRDRSGIVWMTTVTGQVYCLSNGRIHRYVLPNVIADLEIRTIFEDSHGALLMGTNDHGFVKLTGRNAVRYTTADGLRNNTVTDFLEDKRGMLWVATSSGLCRWDGHRFRNYYLQDGLAYGYVRVLARDRNGDILAGTDRGVSRVHEDRIVPDRLLERAGPEKINAIHVDDSGAIWLATRGAGLIRIAHGAVARLTTRSGLLSDSIYQLMDDRRGQLWMSGPVGVYHASIANLNEVADGRADSVAVAGYGIADGMDTTQMSTGFQPAGTMLASGVLAFPSVKGLVLIDPAIIRVEAPSPVRVESLLVDGTPVSLAGAVRIPPGNRRIQIDFTACNLLSAERMSFRYRLRGFSDAWTVAMNQRSAQYSNLPPGHYTFEVMARDGAMPGSLSQMELSFTWLPHFYQTAWFYSGLLVAVLTTIWITTAFFARQERLRYQLRLDERACVARDMHDTVIQGCVGASTLLEAAAGCDPSEANMMREYLDRARIQLRLTLDEARQAVRDLRRDSFASGLAGALEELCETVRNEVNIPVELRVEGEAWPLPESFSRNLLLVAREALRNAVAHAEPPSIGVMLAFTASELRIEVRDDGCGFEWDAGKFSAADHFGITGMRERLEQMGGSFALRTRPGNGATVVAVLPRCSPVSG